MFRRLFHVVLIWFAIWFVAGLFAVAIPYQSPVGHFEDLLFMALAAAVVFLDSLRRVGILLTCVLFLWIALLSGAFELLGAMTGFPFGRYEYSGQFGPRIMGILPWAIPLAWYVVLYPLYLLMLTLCREHKLNSGLVVLGAALAATIVDFALEPVATWVRGYWQWDGAGAYYGVPAQNFVAWFFIAVIILGPVQYYTGRTVMESYHTPGALFLPLAALGSVLVSFLVAGIAHQLWLACGVSVLLTMFLAAIIVRFAWPRRDVFMLERQGFYRESDDRPFL